MVQWWYGHNAVGFFLTAGFLGMMYYFVPKQAGRPVYSYRLSVVHFWALIFTYMWAGPHHLHYTALPDWTQTVGMVFSLILLAPPWGGMINGIMTLQGAWHKLRDDPILKFLITALSFYGMSTFEGPMMSIKTVNALSHYTDWTVGHVHSGALGWVAMISIGSIYYLLHKQLLRLKDEVLDMEDFSETVALKNHGVYTVKPGDSLSVIARRFDLSTQKLVSLNTIDPRAPLRIGQQLRVRETAERIAGAPPKSPDARRKIEYTVKNGDSVARIAGQFNVGVPEVLRGNGLSAHIPTIRPGQVLVLYLQEALADASGPT